MLALVVALCAGQVLAVPNPEGPIFSSPSTSGSLAFFEFAPSNGRGMGTACACTTPTGAKGETMTFTRTGDATCSKQGLATTGIANGDLVVCTANQPRVESSGGVLGLRVEGARTNVLPRSQELDNAAWILDFAGGGVIPTRTANAATAPDGTVTAERLQFSACASAGDASLIYQLHATSGASASTIFCRGNGSTVTISVCSFGSTGSSGCTPVSCPSTSWSRGQDIRTASGTGGLVVGCNNLATYTGASNTGAADVFLWQAQQEMGATYATSPIPTVAALEARNADDAYFDLSTFTLGNLSLAATVQTPSTTPVRRLHGALTKAPDDGANFIATYQDTTVLFGQFTSTAGTSTWNTGLATTTGPVRAASFINGANVGACINSTCATNPIGTFNPAQITSPRRLRIGAYSTTNGNIDGVATLVCFQPDDPTRCR